MKNDEMYNTTNLSKSGHSIRFIMTFVCDITVSQGCLSVAWFLLKKKGSCVFYDFLWGTGNAENFSNTHFSLCYKPMEHFDIHF